MRPSSPRPGGSARAGTVLRGRYVLREPIATGGMARVWRADDQLLQRTVAVKVLLEEYSEDDSYLRRFRSEALLAARLSHPSIVTIYDTVSEDGIEAIVMELVEGETLRDRLRREKRLAPHEAARIGAHIAEALTVAHAVDLVHRDIKPANIMLTSAGRVVVTDFGIAKTPTSDDITQAGQMVGTAKYLAPEQVHAVAVDGRADIYGLGVVLFEAVCERPPFLAETDTAMALARINNPAPDPRSIRPELPDELAQVITRTLARERDDRWPDAGSLAATLRAFAVGHPLPAPPPSLVKEGAAHDTARSGPMPPHPANPSVMPDTVSWRADDPSRPATPQPGPPPPRVNTTPLRVQPDPGDESSVSWDRPSPSLDPRTTTPGPPPPHPDQLPPSPPPPRDENPVTKPRRGPRLLLVGVVAVSLLIIGVLGYQLVRPEPTEVFTPVMASTFDPPEMRGDSSENDHLVALAIDGDVETFWSTEPYRGERDISDIKEGVGLVLHLGERRSVESLHIVSPSQGWTAAAYVLDDVPDASFAEQIDPDREMSDIAGDVTFDLGGRSGAVVMLWITGKGDAETVQIAEATVEVRG